jgi:GTP-binding protein
LEIKSANFVKSAVVAEEFPVPALDEIAFVGKSNVGKSTLINVLLGRRSLVRTSKTPGRTQLINFFLINGKFYFVDLPGYGFARAPMEVKRQWEPMIRRYLLGRKELKAVVLLFDIRRVPNNDDIRMLDWLEEFAVPTIPVITKADKISSGKRSDHISKISLQTGLSPEDFSVISAVTKEGLDDVWDRIKRAMVE